MSQALTLARPYARAAFAVAREAGALAGWSAALGFAARVAAEPQVAVLLDNPKLTRADVVALLSPDGAPPRTSPALVALPPNEAGIRVDLSGVGGPVP